MITRTIKELGKIDKTAFNTFVDLTATKLPDNTSYFPRCNETNIPTGKTNLKSWFSDIKKRAEKLVEKKKAHRTEYDLGTDYTEFGGTAAVDAGTFTNQDIENIFDFCAVLHAKHTE